MSRTSITGPAFLLSLICLTLIPSCGIPLFNEELTLGLLRTSSMQFEAVMGPIGDDEDPDQNLRVLRFLPQRDDSAKGFLQFGSGKLSVAYWQAENQPVWYDEDRSIFDYPAGDDRRLTHLLVPIGKGSYIAHLNISRLEGPTEWRVSVLKYDPDQKRLVDNLAPMQIDLKLECQTVEPAVNPNISSAHIYPSVSAFGEKLFVLCEDADTGQYHEYRFDLIRSGLNGGDHFRGDSESFVFLDFPYKAQPFYYYFPKERIGMVNVFDPDEERFRTVKWNDDLVLEEIEIPYRIDALLSNGRLLCVAEKIVYVFDLDGNETNRFDRDGIEFVHERSEGELVFTFPFYVHSDDEDKSGIYFYIYSLATTEIDTLE